MYNGLDVNADKETFDIFMKSSKKVILNNPVIFIKSRINAFRFLATPSLYSSRMLNLLINLYIPLAISFIFLLVALVYKNWFAVFLVGATFTHLIINLMLLPAAYFKYFYTSFFSGWQIFFITLTLGIDFFIRKRRIKFDK
jgi:hypothetical protein